MNEIVSVEAELKALKIIDDDFEDRYARMKADIDWFESVKYQFLKLGFTGTWTTDEFQMSIVRGAKGKVADTDAMKKTQIYIVNGETGELENVNLYDYVQTFKKETTKKDYVMVKERKD